MKLKTLYFAIPVLVLTGIGYYVYNRIQTIKTVEAHNNTRRYGVMIYSKDDMNNADKRREGFIRQARIMREKWEKTARENKELIITLKKCPKSELPDVKKKIIDFIGKSEKALSPEDIGQPKVNTIEEAIAAVEQDPNVFCMSWISVPVRIDKETQELIKTEMDEHRDVIIGSNAKTSTDNIEVWLSGKITESFNNKNRKQIEPSYDFLTE
jgi:hypothetical protein